MIKKYSQLYFAGATQQQIDAVVKKLNIPQEELLSLANEADPTKENKFEAWLIKQMGLKKIQLPVEKDKTLFLLQDFINFSNTKQLSKRDINQYKLEELQEEISTIKKPELQDAFSHEVNEYLKLPAVSIFGQNKDYLVLKVQNIDSLMKIGDSTEWCTRHRQQAERYLLTLRYHYLYVVFKKEKGKLVKFAQITPDFKEMQDVSNEALVPDASLYSLFKEAVIDTEEDTTKKINALLKFRDIEGLKEYFLKIDTIQGLKEYYYRNFYNGDLRLDNTGITFLPENLHINGRLYIDNCPIEIIPSRLFAQGLTARNCKNLKQIMDFKFNPEEDGVCNSDLRLNGCSSLQELPRDLKEIQGSFSIDSCENITNLPEDLIVTGNCFFADSGLIELPSRFECRGFLDLSNTSISSLPHNLRVTSLYMLNCKNLISIPKEVTIRAKEEVFFEGCSNLKEINARIEAPYIVLTGTAIENVPENIELTEPDETKYLMRGVAGINPRTKRPYHEEYNELKASRKTSSNLRKLKIK